MERRVLTLATLHDYAIPRGATVLVGNGTGHQAVIDALAARGVTALLVEETGSTLRARELYFRAHPPRGVMRLIPAGLRSPPEPVDDYAAYAIALEWIRRNVSADRSPKSPPEGR